MGHHFRFPAGDSRSNLTETDSLRRFIRRYRKGILLALALGLVFVAVFVMLATIFLFQAIIPALMDTANTETAQGVFVTIKDWLLQLLNNSPQEWISLLLQVAQ